MSCVVHGKCQHLKMLALPIKMKFLTLAPLTARFTQRYISALQLKSSLRNISNFSNGLLFTVVVAMPFGAHLSDLALRKIPREHSCLCILNGMTDLEADFLRQQHPNVVFIHIPWTLRHHTVINALIAIFDSPFWLVDHDCLILESDCLYKAEELSAGRIGAVYFAQENPQNGFLKPHTFLMLLRPKLIRSIFKRYKITSAPITWSRLSNQLEEICRAQGFSPDLMPETYKEYFDTFCLTAIIADSEQKGFLAMQTYGGKFEPHPEAIHVGNTSNPCVKPNQHYASTGAYFWSLALHQEKAACLRDPYLAKYPELAHLDKLRSIVIEAGIPEKSLELLESIVQEKEISAIK